MRLKCAACGESSDSAFESCQFCGATLVAEDPEAMARRAKPPEEKERKTASQREEPAKGQPSTILIVGALAGLGVVLIIAGWIGSALVKGATAVGEHEDVQRLERNMNDAFRKAPKRN